MGLEFDKFSKILVGSINTLGFSIDAYSIRLYYKTLSRTFSNIEQFEEATLKLLEEWKYGYMPKPAHFIEKTKLSDDELDIVARKAWGDVREAIREGAGYTKQALFSDDLTEYAVNALLPNGMAGFMDKTYDDMKWLEKDFIKIFKAGYASGRVASLKPNKTALLDDMIGKHIIPPAIDNDSVKVLEAPKQNKASSSVTALANNAINKF